MKRITILLLSVCLLPAWQMLGGPTAAARTANYAETLDITVTTPGTLGDLVLAQTDNFTDVKTLKLSGTLDAADFYTLRQRMTNLVELEMGGGRSYHP